MIAIPNCEITLKFTTAYYLAGKRNWKEHLQRDIRSGAVMTCQDNVSSFEDFGSK
jgi:hypothetical protein